MPDTESKKKTRGKGKMTVAVKEAVENAFRAVNGKHNTGLIELSKSHPAVFYALVAKCIPTAVAVDVKHSIDLGNAMLEASQRLDDYNNRTKTIEHVEPEILKPGITNQEVDANSDDDQLVSVTAPSSELSD